jgi:outer membrane protein assembly factor BamE (lipoprotein component of BamABCDE complex)
MPRNTGERRDVYTDSVEVQTVIVPQRGDIMRKALPLFSLAAALSFPGCALSPVASGMDEAQVQARMGKPETVRKAADGSQIWEYPGGPLGRQSYMVTLGPDQKVSEVRQVLTDENFSKVTSGMSRDEVRQILGRPGEVWQFPTRDEEVWSWRYQQVNPMFFNVLFDRSSGKVRTTQRQEEILWMDQNC